MTIQIKVVIKTTLQTLFNSGTKFFDFFFLFGKQCKPCTDYFVCVLIPSRKHSGIYNVLLVSI